MHANETPFTAEVTAIGAQFGSQTTMQVQFALSPSSLRIEVSDGIDLRLASGGMLDYSSIRILCLDAAQLLTREYGVGKQCIKIIRATGLIWAAEVAVVTTAVYGAGQAWQGVTPDVSHLDGGICKILGWRILESGIKDDPPR